MLMNILKYIISLNIAVTLGCVDIAPLPTVDSSEKLFVVCEMEVGKRITADIYYIGDVNGKKIRQVQNSDFESFSLAEGDKDWGYPFEYHPEDSTFYIETDKFEIKSGLTYRFMGVGQNLKGSEPKIQIPAPIVFDTFIIKDLQISDTLGIYKSDLHGYLVIPEEVKENSFFYIIPKSEDGKIWDVDSFHDNVLAFSRLSHIPGFLVDYSLAGKNSLELSLSICELDTTSYISFDFFHVAESFYRYNLYVSNIISGGNALSINPPIAGFNIQTDRAYGTFSAKTGTNKTFRTR